MPITVIQGEQRGDEGKGRFVDMLAQEHDIVARYNGGPNAGHTVVLPDGRELALHLIPSGIAHEHTMNVIGNGTFPDAVKLLDEIADLESKDIEVSPRNLKISSAAHLILPHHISADEIREVGGEQQGSTKSGIAQVAADKYLRLGMRTEYIKNDPKKLFDVAYEGLLAQREQRKAAGLESLEEFDIAAQYVTSARKLGRFITDTTFYLNQELRRDKPARVLAEGAQAFLLDIDHGMYPFTTSSSPATGGVSTGLGVPSMFIDRVVGISKAVQSHVGGGPFVTEIEDAELLEALHGDMKAIDAESGTTTGRVRRLGHIDLPQIRRSQMINGTQEMALSKLDWVQRYGKEILVCVAYERKGRILEIAPDSARKLEQCIPIYEKLPNWTKDIQGTTRFSRLPKKAQQYIKFIENITGVPITMIGTGPNRDEVIKRK